MRVMLLFKNDMDNEGLAPTPEMIEAFKKMDEFTEELVKAGVFVAGAGLKPSAQSKRVVYDGRGRTTKRCLKHPECVKRKSGRGSCTDEEPAFGSEEGS